MRLIRAGTWEHPKRKHKLTGKWEWSYASDRFIIYLDKRDSITGQQRVISVYGENPEWDKWKLVKENGNEN